MKPETRKRAWLISVVLTLWPASLFAYQTIVADPRYKFEGAMQVEFFVCIFAIAFAVAALVLHTRKSAAGLIISLVLLGAAIACFLNTEGGSMVIYKDWSPAKVTVAVDEVGPVQVEFGDSNSEGELYIGTQRNLSSNGIVKDVRVCAAYQDLLGRDVSSEARPWPGNFEKGQANFVLPGCFSGKKLTVSIYVITTENKVHRQYVTVEIPKKPFWSP